MKNPKKIRKKFSGEVTTHVLREAAGGYGCKRYTYYLFLTMLNYVILDNIGKFA